ncbi:MAG: phospholipid/cholesterol/gamma-HCH transport system substrate-binding protein [Mycobacterium sp.]|jgi:virulence factor Mce-like protein|nr:phospholipid/cholesterol/gamma-HCH transport system substrate-binding protein [Mycobacterium sp.]MDT5205775.1 phospholipid/cholesterol/gamma-HCH transport system substrate-binding protein [Mycobacterium sp.]MDT5227641.1 phospholipid/cholesterol/gamma-HCH transport system substrate-binding protein [Mycobacterium sp.]
MLMSTGCAFHGLNSLPLPGAVGRGPDADVYHVELANVITMESNSPVMIDDVVVGSVGPMTVKDWHANVQISVKRGVVVPANVEASIGQTSLLGSMHLELNPPVGQPGMGRLRPGATIPLSRSSTYPSTEQTLSSLSLVVNGGGLGQIGEIIHNFSAALAGRGGAVRDLINRFDTFVGTLDQQRDNIVASIQALDQIGGTFAAQREVLTEALRKVPPALDVLITERPRLTAALDGLRKFSNTATGLINDTQADLVRNLKNLEPTVKSLADVGPDLDTAIAALTVFPFTQNFVDRAVRGDYFNLHVQLDLSIPRLKRGLFLGTHWGQLGEQQIPGPGDPPYLQYTRDPLHGGFGPPPGPPPPGPPASPAGVPPAGPQAPPPPGPPAPGPAQPNLQFSAPLPGPAAAPLPGPVAPDAAPPSGIPPTEGSR